MIRHLVFAMRFLNRPIHAPFAPPLSCVLQTPSKSAARFVVKTSEQEWYEIHLDSSEMFDIDYELTETKAD